VGPADNVDVVIARLGAVLILEATLAFAACTPSPTQPLGRLGAPLFSVVTTYPIAIGPQYLGAVRSVINFGGMNDVHLRPPAARPAVSWTRALEYCSPSCGRVYGTPKLIEPIVELASYSDDQYMVNGSNHPIYRNVVAYVVMWRSVPCINIGPPNQPTPRPNEPPERCVDFYLVAAASGRLLDIRYQYETI
jgi:hypothetical protein